MSAQKQLTLKLKSVSYGGKSIGREFTFEITAGSVTKKIRRDVAYGTTVTMSKNDSIILTETIESTTTSIPVKIKVTEDDPYSDDTAETSGLIKFNYDQVSIQSSSLSISVTENSLLPILNPPVTAELTFNFEVQVSEMGIRYLPEQGGQGFVDVIVSSTGERIALPGYLKSNYIKIANNRDYFIPYEGKWKDQELSITRKPDGESYLIEGKILAAARIVVNPTTAKLWYGAVGSEVGPVFAEIDPQKPLPDGEYNLSVPDEPHRDFGDQYLNQTSYAMVWYPIPADINQDGIEDDRFLHCGRVSAGCITVRDFSYWTKLHKYLYNRRLRDDVVGIITIDSQYTG
jgi:hypothetical protein